jgi:hypothetical protein
MSLPEFFNTCELQHRSHKARDIPSEHKMGCGMSHQMMADKVFDEVFTPVGNFLCVINFVGATIVRA